MSGGGEQPDILTVGILVKERWKVVSMSSCNSFSFLKILLLGYSIQLASDYVNHFGNQSSILFQGCQQKKRVSCKFHFCNSNSVALSACI